MTRQLNFHTFRRALGRKPNPPRIGRRMFRYRKVMPKLCRCRQARSNRTYQRQPVFNALPLGSRDVFEGTLDKWYHAVYQVVQPVETVRQALRDVGNIIADPTPRKSILPAVILFLCINFKYLQHLRGIIQPLACLLYDRINIVNEPWMNSGHFSASEFQAGGDLL